MVEGQEEAGKKERKVDEYLEYCNLKRQLRQRIEISQKMEADFRGICKNKIERQVDAYFKEETKLMKDKYMNPQPPKEQK